ncbi:Tetratricopeptide repeat-like superfamily protein isoform 1 [Tripterygium wilfordii]|uniref:Tetratricopeptide repeat-like superfamily protein isoform 1 n=1 Tax=Tripterygium wilfordii TaxID=458696 RepID=A0A7J7DSL1_TRIWF|nr:pentatricopeptide repeat-containing protein At1g77360, mitochondrial-like [Tripterygium wilfordii]XP_038699752.1 pentatricopeptide repeat-containing protein At1g77360, mitochondrial-like [Tripterygium wilfordii]KAF5749116.1 Tetratricopeptide repeat-like superfamily protein isoform 1 [Tripterygium wilfordii]
MDENPSTRLQYPSRIISSTNHSHPKSPQKPSLKQQPQNFPSHLDAPDVSPSVRGLCEILIRASPHDIESALSSSGIAPTQDIVNEVLRFSYNYPSSAVKFFRWVGLSLKHSALSWNLVVDLLGKNGLFEPMWDAIRSMKQEGVLSLATFVSVFGTYCVSNRFDEAIMSFEVMEKYGVQQDVVAVNSLLSAICREKNQTSKALEWLERIKSKIPPNGDTYAILLEGWERDGNVAKAMTTFGEMVVHIGWSPENMSAYDTFLTTLVRGHQCPDAVKFLKLMKGNNCLPGLKFFSNALDILIKQNDSSHAILLWDIMVGSGLVPNLIMYNAMIGLLCDNNEIHDAIRLLDDMVFHGAFPDSLTYNMIFQCLIKDKKVREVGKFFVEMIKNEWPPTPSNFSAAIAMLFDGDDPEMAFEIWNYMVENQVSSLDDSANALLIGLRDLDRLSEVRRVADDMLLRRINIYESTMEKLKNAFYKCGRSGRDKYDRLSRRWKHS